MTEQELITELAAVPENCWISSAYSNQAGPVTWLPLVRISDTGIWLGLDRNGAWTLGRLDGVVESSSSENLPASWVTILDSDETSLRAGLHSAAERFGLSPYKLVDLIPVDEVLTMAIKSRSSWAERAVSWMSRRSIPRDHLQLLREVSTAEWANQRTRHMARRIVKASGQ